MAGTQLDTFLEAELPGSWWQVRRVLGNVWAGALVSGRSSPAIRILAPSSKVPVEGERSCCEALSEKQLHPSARLPAHRHSPSHYWRGVACLLGCLLSFLTVPTL